MIFLSTFCRAQPLLKLSVKPAFHMGVESSHARAHRAVRGSQEQIYGFLHFHTFILALCAAVFGSEENLTIRSRVLENGM